MRIHIRELGHKYRLEDSDVNRPKQFRGEHPGLILHRLLAEQLPPEDESAQQAREQKKRALAERHAIFHAAINASANTEVRELYKAAYARWKNELDRDTESTISTILQTPDKCRLIVGLGTENVLETGIRLHHTYGLPLLPGSALKGLAAHYCDQVWGESEARFKKPTTEQDKAYRKWLNGEGPKPEENFHRLLFGSTDDCGCIVFHDAWFVPDSEREPLKLDVMTPHHPKWLDGSEPPTDFDSPIPVPFLSVAGQFHVAVSWHGPKDPDEHWKRFFDRAAVCLRNALFDWGIGGKTTSGYGRFDEDKWQTGEQARLKDEARRKEAAEKEAALAAMSPIERSIKVFLERHPNKQAPEYMKLLEELKKEGCRWTSDDDKREVARRIKLGMQEAKKWGKKDKDAERTALIKKILGES